MSEERKFQIGKEQSVVNSNIKLNQYLDNDRRRPMREEPISGFSRTRNPDVLELPQRHVKAQEPKEVEIGFGRSKRKENKIHDYSNQNFLNM